MMNKIKIGDWVIDKNHKQKGGDDSKPFRVEFEVEEGSYIAEDCELWKPKNGELCWFWNYDSDNPVLGKHDGIYLSGHHMIDRLGVQVFRYSEPFTGEIPTIFLKREASNGM